MTEMEQKRILSKNLQDLIAKSGKEQKQVAFDLGEKPNTFNQWVKGRAIPSVSALHKVATYFNVSFDMLVNEYVNPDIYYTNPDAARIAQKLYEDRNYRILFDAAQDAKPEDILMAADILKRFKETNPNG